MYTRHTYILCIHIHTPPITEQRNRRGKRWRGGGERERMIWHLWSVEQFGPKELQRQKELSEIRLARAHLLPWSVCIFTWAFQQCCIALALKCFWTHMHIKQHVYCFLPHSNDSFLLTWQFIQHNAIAPFLPLFWMSLWAKWFLTWYNSPALTALALEGLAGKQEFRVECN